MTQLKKTVNELTHDIIKSTASLVWELYNKSNKKNKDYKMLAHDLDVMYLDMEEVNNIGDVIFKNTHQLTTKDVLEELTRWIKGRFYPTCENMIITLINVIATNLYNFII